MRNSGSLGGVSSSALRRQLHFEKLRRAAAFGAATNPHDAALSTATVSTTTAADAALSRVYAGALMLSAIRVTGGRAVPYGSAYVFRVADMNAQNGNLAGLLPATPSYNSWITEIEFAVDTATKVQVRVTANASFFHRVLVDGRYVSKTPIAYTATGENILTVDLSPLPQGPHTIKIELDTNQQFISIAVPPTASVSRPVPTADRVIALSTGDSFSEGQGSSYKQMGAWPKILGRRMGWTDVRQVAVGGTGYTNVGALPLYALPDQVARWPIVNDDIDMTQVDVVTIASGYNDVDAGTNPASPAYQAAYAAALLTFQRVRALCPNAHIFVLGAWNATRGNGSVQSTNVENATRAAWTAWADPYTSFLPVTTAMPQSWFTGTGRVGTPNGSGNTDFLISSDGVHPSDMGHEWIARRAEAAIRQALRSR